MGKACRIAWTRRNLVIAALLGGVVTQPVAFLHFETSSFSPFLLLVLLQHLLYYFLLFD